MRSTADNHKYACQRCQCTLLNDVAAKGAALGKHSMKGSKRKQPGTGQQPMLCSIRCCTMHAANVHASCALAACFHTINCVLCLQVLVLPFPAPTPCAALGTALATSFAATQASTRTRHAHCLSAGAPQDEHLPCPHLPCTPQHARTDCAQVSCLLYCGC
jgi:hypothetical protein